MGVLDIAIFGADFGLFDDNNNNDDDDDDDEEEDE